MSPLRTTYLLNVLNGEPFIRYQLDSIYPHAHQIIIVEGAYKRFSYAAPNYRSTDKTLDIIAGYPDPCHKITLISNPFYYEDRLEMCNEAIKHVDCDILWQIDVDEFYSDSTHEYIRKAFSRCSQLDQVSFHFRDYYKGLEYIVSGYDKSLVDVIRVIRFSPGMTWLNQRPPTLGLNGKSIQPRLALTGSQLAQDGHYLHNLSLLFDSQVKDKYQYYSLMWPKSVSSPSHTWYQDSWIN